MSEAPRTDQRENFEQVWRLYGFDQALEDLTPLWEMELASRDHLLRHHYQGGVSDKTEQRLRATLDALLHACGVLEVGLRAGVLADETDKMLRLSKVLEDSVVQSYYQERYPLRLPGTLRRRIRERRVAESAALSPSWFARLLTLDTSFRNPQLETFLKIVDGFWYADITFPQLRELVRSPEPLLDAVATPIDERSRPQEALAGLERFLFFCGDLQKLLEAAPERSLIQDGAFDLYRYWFEIRSDKLATVVDDALESLTVPVASYSMSFAPSAEDLPERAAMKALFARATHTTAAKAAASNPAPSASLREIMKVDAWVVRVLEKALPQPFGAEVLNRIRADYLADTGAVSILRQLHHASGSLADTARFYWSSRREETARLESVISAVTLNAAAGSVLSALRALLDVYPDQTSKLLVARDLSPDLVSGAPAPIDAKVWTDLARMVALYRLRSTDEAAANAEVANVLQGHELSLSPSADDLEAVDVMRTNIEVIAKGLVQDAFGDIGVSIVAPTNGLSLIGMPASPGTGFGVCVTSLDPQREDYVFAAARDMHPHAQNVAAQLSGAKAVICTGGMTSHVPIFCRGVGVPCVVLDDVPFVTATQHKWLLVFGNTGEVYCYRDRPEMPPLRRPRPPAGAVRGSLSD